MVYFLFESLRMALSSLRSNKLRSLLTTLGIVIGITTVIAIIAVITGLNKAFSRELSSIGSNVLYIQKWHWASNDWSLTRKWKDIGDRELHAVQAGMTKSDKASPVLSTVRKVKYKSRKAEDTFVSGAGEGYGEIRGVFPASGRYLTQIDHRGARNVAVIGWELAERLFRQEAPVGKSIQVGGRKFQVVGVLEKRGDFFDMNLDRIVIMPIEAFMKNFGRQRSLTIVVRPKNPEQPQSAIDELRSIMRRARHIPFGEPDNFAINQVDTLRELYDKLTGGLYAAMFGVATISLIVGGIGIMNIMLVSVTERTKEIGIRKAVGARRSNILVQFLIEAILLSILGGIIGVAAGFAISWIVNAVSPVPARVEWWSVGLGLGFSATVGIVFGAYPARRAATRDPIVSLRYE
ncbi:MAG: ABC transporter permease [Deltaproteobacteria bacterium]|nr:ABC transporter permease [Deltaproteobacteria bacterium]